MNVRLRHLRDAEALLRGGADVLIDIAVRVDHDRLAGFRTADQVTGLRQGRFKEAFDKH